MQYHAEQDGADHGRQQGRLRQQFVRLGRARGDFITVQSGLKPGERIVRAGVFKLRNEMPVVENNEVAPEASETPKPADS